MAILLESGSKLLLESGGALLLESDPGPATGVVALFPASLYPAATYPRALYPPPAGGGAAPASAPFATGRDRTLLRAAADLLAATGAFDAVVTTGLPGERGRSAADDRMACLELQSWEEHDQSDDYDATPQDRQVTYLLHLIVRAEDADLRDDELDRLLAVAQNALSGVSLGGETLPDWTRLRRGQWHPPAGDERRMTVTGIFTYQVSDFDRHLGD